MDKGFFNTKVKVLQIPDSTRGQATLNFTITKGKKVKIDKIGNIFLPDHLNKNISIITTAPKTKLYA